MMENNVAISVKGLSKTYRLYPSNQARLKEFFHLKRKKYHTKFHALKEINFELRYGEVLGIIGQNGSGKSTLLKILASVVSPTSGSFECNGRVTALLELSSGFNKELTGIENIFFLGAIQGFTKKEMKKRTKEILDFADIGKYAYQPIKSYSSGMAVRLAFSINIHIDPDILIVDEALAVGDIRFQQKCYRKIREFKEAGKTILFCSHSLSAVKDFCTKAFWIHKGKIMDAGDPHAIADRYNAFMAERDVVNKMKKLEGEKVKNTLSLPDYLSTDEFKKLKWFELRHLESFGNNKATIKYATIVDPSSNKSELIINEIRPLRLLMVVETSEELDNAGVEIQLNGKMGVSVMILNNRHYKQRLRFKVDEPNIVAVDFLLPELSNGRYSYSLAATQFVNGKMQYLHWVHDAIFLEMKTKDIRYSLPSQVVLPDVNFEVL